MTEKKMDLDTPPSHLCADHWNLLSNIDLWKSRSCSWPQRTASWCFVPSGRNGVCLGKHKSWEKAPLTSTGSPQYTWLPLPGHLLGCRWPELTSRATSNKALPARQIWNKSHIDCPKCRRTNRRTLFWKMTAADLCTENCEVRIFYLLCSTTVRSFVMRFRDMKPRFLGQLGLDFAHFASLPYRSGCSQA